MKFHFKEEEELLKKLNYPELESHQKQHDIYAEKVKSFKKDIEIGKLQLKFDIFSFLKDWLMNHIVANDKKYMKYFKQNKVKEYFEYKG